MSKGPKTPDQRELADYIRNLTQEKQRLRERLAAIERDERQAIQAASCHGLPHRFIANMTGLTDGRVSQIVNESPRSFIPIDLLEDQKKIWNWDLARTRTTHPPNNSNSDSDTTVDKPDSPATISPDLGMRIFPSPYS